MKCFLLLFMLYLCAGAATGQSVHWPARYFNAGNGLPQNTVYDMVQDDEGWLWISTDNGVCLYDGYQFRHAEQLKGGAALERGAAFFLKEGPVLWIFQKNNIAKYDLRQKNISVYTAPSTGFTLMYPVFSDSSRILYRSGHIYAFDKKTGLTKPATEKEPAFRKIWTIDYPKLKTNDYYALHHDDSLGGLYLARLDTSSLRINDIRTLPDGIRDFCKLGRAFLFIDTKGVIYLAEDQDAPLRRVANSDILADRYHSLVSVQLDDHTYVIGIGTDVFHVQTGNGFSIRRVTQTDGSSLVQKGKLLCLLKDRTGNVWIGTNAEGLVQIPTPGNSFMLYRSAQPEKNFIRTIHTDAFTGDIWAGLYFDNVVVFDRYGMQKKELTERMGRMLGKHGVINYIHQLSRYELLVFADLQKTFYVNLEKGTARLCEVVRNGISDTAYFRMIKSLSFVTPLGNNRFWQLFDMALHRISYRNNKIYIDFVVDLPLGASALYAENNNSFWIGVTGKAIQVDSTGQTRDSLLTERGLKVTAITRDKAGQLWIGTNYGLFVFNKGKLVQTFTRKNNLPDNCFYALAADSTGHVWGSTNRGLIQFDIYTMRFAGFSEKDGLQGSEFNTGAMYNAADGRIFFGGISGLNAFYPSMSDTTQRQLKVYFTGMMAGDSVLFSPFDILPGKIKLPAGTNSLSVSFSVFNFFTPGANEYEYRLGNEKEWLSATGRNDLQLVLTPGEYNLQVRIKGRPDSMTSVLIYLQPPFYRSWLFVIACAVLVVFIAGLIIYLYTRAQYRKKIAALALREKVQQEKERISRELHDDLGVKANLLSYNASLLIDHAGTTDKSIGMRIKDAADDMLLALRDTMWTLKQEQISTTEVWLRFKNFISKMQRSYQQISFTVENESITETLLAYNDALNLIRILQETTNNAIRHSNTTVIHFSASSESGYTTFTVRDEGRGFAETATGLGDGLANMRYRAGQSGFLLEVQSEKSTGTTITVRV
ncbi:sensor histidine kinase [Sediminibacterium ginsengisoli]|uniref:Two component regulator propeller n=1 Tax=Sediminibacterium ginsengisoli TaxID=413434 RepID=A0A1T4P7F0_9BACT|nr:two-component regulator propeller domain-containing protein [Sediminibacterium ginsengisoli]SJZ87389.1 Two component regulator propeller [Sediminibacterium ginsengisoli]